MRYFLVTFISSKQDQQIIGNIWFQNESFPSNEWMKNHIQKDGSNQVVITNIYEFNSKSDYLCFINKGENTGI